MDRGDLTLSRRQVVTAAGVVGAAATGAGVGTDAVLSDTESFDGNRVVAGDLDLRVAWAASADGPMVNDAPRSAGYPTPRSDATAPVVDLSDVKPGDSGHVDCRLLIGSNPGYVSLVGGERRDAENGQPDPELGRLDGARPAGAEGELDEFIDVTVSYPDTGLSAYTASLSALVGLGALGTGLVLDGAGTTTVVDSVLGDGSATPFPAGRERRVRIEWSVPPTLGNGVQTDSYRFALGFYGEQARHNRP
jgi:hypothetical protein